MGLPITQTSFEDVDYQRFSKRLQEQLKLLQKVIAQPGFGEGPSSFGAELELYIVDQAGMPACLNTELESLTNNPQLQLELNRYNLEYNLTPVLAKGKPFTALATEMEQVLTQLSQTAQQFDARVLPIGILPTLTERDLRPEVITDQPRYHVLSDNLSALKKGDFKIDIHGEDDLSLSCSNVSLEGANTSLQVHWRVSAQKFVDAFNAVQLVSPLAVAISANSPTLMGCNLWDETRIAVFKQSIDYRQNKKLHWRQPSRVPYGFGWLRQSPWELFAETVALFPPIIPVSGTEDYEQTWRNGEMPQFTELCLHQGTVWPWNRAIYDANAGGHLRIEMRSLPAGPTVADMVANSAFYIGLSQAMTHNINELLPSLPYRYAEYNFYHAARHGLDAHLIWPTENQSQPKETPVLEIIQKLLPAATSGLIELGVDEQEAIDSIALIEARLQSRQTGARWQKQMLHQYKKTADKADALSLLLEKYMSEYNTGKPVAEWSTKI